jgi:hypothetical protein
MVALTEIKKISYVDANVLGDRVLFLMPLWDGSNWRQWFELGDGTLVEGKIVDVVRSEYVSKQAVAEDDLWIPFVDFMWQRASWPEMVPLIRALCDDFHQFAASTAKLKHFFHTREQIPRHAVSSFVDTELEYLVVVARTVFDLLQEAISIVWNGRIRLLDAKAEARRKQHKLPPTFSKMVLDGKGGLKTADEIIDRYALAPVLAEEYVKQAPFFASLRAARNKVVHGGAGMPIVFVTEKGFCVDPKAGPFADFKMWDKAHYFNDNIASLLPWVAHVVFQTIHCCTEIMAAFARQIQFPPEIAPEYHVFIRDNTSDALLDLLKVHKGELVWWGSDAGGVASGTG